MQTLFYLSELMTATPDPAAPPEFNVTGIDYRSRGHFRYAGPIVDVHTHLLRTRPTDPIDGPPAGEGPGASLRQAEAMMKVAEDFGVVKIYTMCFADDIAPLRERFGDRLGYIGMINKKSRDQSDASALALLESFLQQGAEIIKFWSAPRGLDRGLFVDSPWRIEATRRARAAGIRVMMVHIADPDVWFETVYTDVKKYGTKPEQYLRLRRMLEEFPELKWIGAHMGGDPEHPGHLQELLETYPHYYIDTSATKWQVREVSKRRQAIHRLICKFPDRFLFGSDLVTRHHLQPEHYASRYWCQRTLWESDWRGQSPIADPDHSKSGGEGASPILHGIELPLDVVQKLYYQNAREVLNDQ